MTNAPNCMDLLVQTISFDQYMGNEYLVPIYPELEVKYIEIRGDDFPTHQPSFVLVYYFFMQTNKNCFKYKFNGLRVM